MRTKHTPGPWFQGTGIHQYCVYDKKVWINPDGSRGGDTPNIVVVVSPADALADARLIAAAPDLLAIAMEAKALLERGPDATEAEREDVWRGLSEAIAKATGEKMP